MGRKECLLGKGVKRCLLPLAVVADEGGVAAAGMKAGAKGVVYGARANAATTNVK
jgi:hypothetical protein